MSFNFKEKLAQIKNKISENPGTAIVATSALASTISVVAAIVIKNILDERNPLKIEMPKALYDDIEAGKCDGGLYMLYGNEYFLTKNRDDAVSTD